MILSKSSLVTNIQNELSDNSTGQISPYDVRHNLLDIIDSVHLLTSSQNLAALNFSTPSTRTTKAGEYTLEKLSLDGYSSIDNSAFGYSALKANYTGEKNTAIGAFSLSCNIYGNDNVGIGFHSLAGNTVGYGNIGLGNFSLNNNKVGNFNIALGHGAGYYVDRETNYKLYIAAHAVNEDYVCDNPTGSGLIPLIHGDLASLKLGIATKSLHSYGALQVDGNITPSNDNANDLGHPLARFKKLYLSNDIVLDNFSLKSSPSGIVVSGNIIPALTKTFNLGNASSKWMNGYFENIYVSGEAIINHYTTIETAQYFNKTLILAASGNPSFGYLSDNSLLDAGLIIKSSGSGYLRDYTFTFVPPNSGQSCIESDSVYAQACWNSNISLHLNSGNHLKVDQIISHDDLKLITPSSCYGINIDNQERFYLSRSNILTPDPKDSNGHLAGVGNVNFFANSGDASSNYFVSIAAIESGVTVGQRFLTGIKKRSKDSFNEYKDKLSGFEIKYIDDANSNTIGALTDRLLIGSYNNTSMMKNGLVLMKDNGDGILCITNAHPTAENMLPNTALNIRATGNANIRVTTENAGDTTSSLQLLGTYNCLSDGCELEYLNASGLADLSIYKASGKVSFIRLNENNSIGLFNGSGSQNAMLTIGDDFYTNSAISLHVFSGSLPSTAKYGKLYIQTKNVDLQHQSLYMIDGSGFTHDLIVNKYDTNDARAIYTDTNGNTFGGILCPDKRNDLAAAVHNTAIGYKSLYAINSGDYNTVIGSCAASGITTGSKNIIIGYRTTSNNISDNNIIIGNDFIGNTISGDYNFIIGATSNNILLKGRCGPTNYDKYLEMPSGGQFSVSDATNTNKLLLKSSTIEMIDLGGSNYPDNSLIIKFTGNNSSSLCSFNHSANPMSNFTSYQAPATLRPFMQMNGDIKLRGAIRFSDATSLDSSSFLNNITVLESGMLIANSGISGINSTINSIFVEGYVPSEISAPANFNTQTSGDFIIKDQNWNTLSTGVLYNRDISSAIHAGAYVIALNMNGKYRPVWISSHNTCDCCSN